jgi:hypothetical protein
MTKKAARAKLESNGYKVVGLMQGGYIAMYLQSRPTERINKKNQNKKS